jgi:hypothetical protein
MHMELRIYLADCVERLYRSGYSCHRDIQVGRKEFEEHLYAIVEKSIGIHPNFENAAAFINSLHGNDLYLAIACSQHIPAAWNRFTIIYQKYIYDLTAYTSPVKSMVYELADTILADLFLPNRSGLSRIASYDGRSSLATWLRVIICNRVINERKLKFNTMTQLNEEAFEKTVSFR